MSRANKSMTDLLAGVNLSEELTSTLSDLLSKGIFVCDGCVFIKSLFQARQESLSKFIGDETGREIFVNSIHTDDYVSTNHLAQALALSRAIQNLLNSSNNLPVSSMEILLAVTEFGVNVKLFGKREGQAYLSENLEGFQQPLLEITLDVPFQKG